MAKIEWHQAFSLGVASLDGQHRRIVELADDILQAVREGRGARHISSCFSKLREHSVYHFGDEEAFMRSVGYPALKTHAAEHEEIKKLVRYHQERLFRQGTVKEKEVLDFLRRLLVVHVAGSDMAVSRFLDERKKQASPSTAA